MQNQNDSANATGKKNHISKIVRTNLALLYHSLEIIPSCS